MHLVSRTSNRASRISQRVFRINSFEHPRPMMGLGVTPLAADHVQRQEPYEVCIEAPHPKLADLEALLDESGFLFEHLKRLVDRIDMSPKAEDSEAEREGAVQHG